MRTLARQLDGDIHTAQDLCQQTLFTAWQIALRNPSSVPIKEMERVWLFTIARNHLRNHRRLSRHAHQIHYDAHIIDHVHVAESADSALYSRDIDPNAKLRGLSPGDRLILEMKYVDDLSGDEIAKLLGIRPATARQRLNRAIKRACELLKSQADPAFVVAPFSAAIDTS